MSIQNHSSPSNNNTISPTWRYATNVLSLISVLFFSGIIFGWAPLELMLLEEGQYNQLCLSSSAAGTAGDEDKDVDVITNDDGDNEEEHLYCAFQMNRLNAMFTLAQFWLSFASLPVGFLLDIAPKPIHFTIAGIFEISGLLLMAISDSSSSAGNGSKTDDYFILGYSLLALGGCMTMLGAFPASFLLPQYQAGILASISCLFDASSIIFFVFYKLYEHFPTVCTRQQLFFGWTIVAVFVYTSLVFCWTHLERHDWKSIVEQQEENDMVECSSSQDEDQEQKQSLLSSPSPTDDDDKNNNNENIDPEKASSVVSTQADSSINGSPPPPVVAADNDNNNNNKKDFHADRIQDLGIQNWSVPQQLATYEYGLAVLFASCQMLRCNFYIMTVDHYLDNIGDTPDAKYAKIFSWILPCGIVFVPLIEMTVTNLGVLSTLHITNCIGLIFGLLLWIPIIKPIQVINFAIFTGFRAYLYSTLNTFIAVTFGVNTMGRIIGFVFTTAAIISLIQYPLAVWTTVQQHGNFLPVNIGLVGLCILPILTSILYDYYCCRHSSSSSSKRGRGQQQERGELLKQQQQQPNANNDSSYGSIASSSPTTPTRTSARRRSLAEGNTAYVLSSPGSPSLAAIRRSRQEMN